MRSRAKPYKINTSRQVAYMLYFCLPRIILFMPQWLGIMLNETGIMPNKKSIVLNEAGIMPNKKSIVLNEAGIMPNEKGAILKEAGFALFSPEGLLLAKSMSERADSG